MRDLPGWEGSSGMFLASRTPLCIRRLSGKPFSEPEEWSALVAGSGYKAAQSSYSPSQTLNLFGVRRWVHV